jgi:hypothetical protein
MSAPIISARRVERARMAALLCSRRPRARACARRVRTFGLKYCFHMYLAFVANIVSSFASLAVFLCRLLLPVGLVQCHSEYVFIGQLLSERHIVPDCVCGGQCVRQCLDPDRLRARAVLPRVHDDGHTVPSWKLLLKLVEPRRVRRRRLLPGGLDQCDGCGSVRGRLLLRVGRRPRRVHC